MRNAYVNRCCHLGDRNIIKKEAEKILKYKDHTIDMQHIWNIKKSDTNNNRNNWNHLKIIQKIPPQPVGKARNQGTTENSHTGYCTRTSESTIVKYKAFNM
jgi:hypothetical protein